jgi:hypothetical protein
LKLYHDNNVQTESIEMPTLIKRTREIYVLILLIWWVQNYNSVDLLVYFCSTYHLLNSAEGRWFNLFTTKVYRFRASESNIVTSNMLN